MKLVRHLAAALVALVLAACSQPVPPERIAYVGEWRAPDMRLVITLEGHVEYERRNGKNTTRISAPIQRYDGDDFTVGFGPVRTRFVVSTPPHPVAGVWKMVVDGVELEKVRAFEGTQV